MKKFLSAILSVLLFVCLGAAVACAGGNDDGTYYTLVFRHANGVRYDCDVPSGWEVQEGTTVNFKLILDDDVEGEPVVIITNLSDENAEEQVLTANDKGVYSFVITYDTQVRVDGIIAKGEYNIIKFQSTPGVMYNILTEGLENGMAVRSGKTVRFSLTRGEGYQGDPQVYANSQLLEADGNGVYSFEMTEPTTIRVEGIFKLIDLSFKAADTHVKYLDVTVNGEKLTDKDDQTIDKIENSDYTTKIYAGDVVRFKVQVSVYYVQTGYQVLAGTTIVKPNDDGVYEVTVQGSTTIQLSKLTLEANFTERADGGSGTEYDPFRISKPIDLYMMAMLINGDFYTDGRFFNGYYRLENDIDLEGEQLYIIGDGSTGIAFFAGHFDGRGHTISNYYMTDEWINQESYQEQAITNVGLFGSATPTLSSSPEISNLHLDNFTITVNASRYPDNAPSGETYETYIGALIGVSFGASVTGCTATNGKIEVTAHPKWPSYVGGLIGQQMSAYATNGSFAYYAPVVSCHTDVDINIYGNGFAYATGGISGLLVVGEEHVSSYILNSYSNGDINGGLNAGGIVGYASAGTSIINSYSTGDVFARSSYAYNEGYGTDEFYRANAGGIVGRLGFNAVVYNCFSTGEPYASNHSSVKDKTLVKIDPVAAYRDSGADLTDASMHEPSIVGSRGVALSEVNEAFVRNTMKWHEADWVMKDGMPVINFSDSEKEFTVFFNATSGFGTVPEGFRMSTYRTMSNWNLQQNGIPEFVEGNGGIRSYAYFFEPELKNRVPYSFIPTDDMILYIGYADYSEVVGTYFLGDDINSKARLTLNSDGTFEYRNGGLNITSLYTWDGEQIVLRNTYIGDISKRSELADAEYREYYLSSLYTFEATIDKESKTLYIQGGYVQEVEIKEYIGTDAYGNPVTIKDYESTGNVFYLFNEKELKGTILIDGFNYGEYAAAGSTKYTFYGNGTGIRTGSDVLTFTYTWNKNNTLTIKYSNGETTTATVVDGYVTKIGSGDVKPYDGFTGTWEREFAMNSVYTFDGMGNWTYKSFTGTGSGSYTVKNGVLEAGSFSAVVNSDGYLEITKGTQTIVYYAEGSFVGEWYYNQRLDDGATATSIVINLTLNGIKQDGYGTGKAEFGTGELYDLEYHATVSGDNITIIYIYSGITLFGELRYDETSNLLLGKIDGRNARLAAYDNYQGVWVSDNEDLATVQFNGLGYYDLAGSSSNDYLPIQSKVWVGNKAAGKYKLDRATLTATYTYKNVEYTLKYNQETGYIDVTAEGVKFTLQPRDIWYGNDLIDSDGFVYSFDGRGNLEKGGVVYADNGRETDLREYRYTLSADGTIVLKSSDPENYRGGTISIKEVGGKQVFQFARDNSTAISLTRHTPFTGEWIISGERRAITIGKIYADNTAEGTYTFYKFDGKKTESFTRNIALTYNLDGKFMTFEYKEEDGVISTIYINAIVSKNAAELSLGYYNDITNVYNYICVTKDNSDPFYNKELKVYDSEKNADTGETLIYDGLGYSVFGYGTAVLYDAEGKVSTAYSYNVDRYGHARLSNGYRQYCMVPWTKGEDLSYFVLFYVHDGDEYFAVVQPDQLYGLRVKDKEISGVTYEFNGVGSVTRYYNGVEDGTYDYLIVLTDRQEYLHVIAFTDKNGKIYSVTLDQKSGYSDEWTIVMSEADFLFTVVASDANDENAVFLFCGNGRVVRLSTEAEAINYTYKIVSGEATDKIITLEFTTSAGKTYLAILDRTSENEEEWTVTLSALENGQGEAR